MLAVACALLALVGHMWPVTLGFRGGKGVATMGGILFALNWETALIAMGVWVLVFIPSRYVSLGSVAAALSLPVAQHFTGHHFKHRWEAPMVVTVFLAVAGVLVIVRHQANLKRLWAGTEPKFGRKKADS